MKIYSSKHLSIVQRDDSGMLSHLLIMSLFEKTASVIKPNFFIDKNVAKDFLGKEIVRKGTIKRF